MRMDLPAGCLDVPATLNITDHIVTRHALLGRGARAALDCDGEVLTFSALDVEADRAGAALQAAGIEAGDRFLVCAENSLRYVLFVLGGMKIGAVPVLASEQWAATTLAEIVGRTRAKGVLRLDGRNDGFGDLDLAAHEPTAEEHGGIVAETGADDAAYVTCPVARHPVLRAVTYAHRSVIAAGDPIRYGILRLTPDDRCLVPVDLGEPFAIDFAVHYPLAAGATSLVHRGPSDGATVLAAIQTRKPTLLVGMPSLFAELCDTPAVNGLDLTSLRLAVSIGSLPDEVHGVVRHRFGLDVVALFGRPETHLFAATSQVAPRWGTLGLPLPGRQVEVLTEDGRPAAVGEAGYLAVPSSDPALALGYEGLDDDWRAKHRDGWHHTTLQAYRDADGHLWPVGLPERGARA